MVLRSNHRSIPSSFVRPHNRIMGGGFHSASKVRGKQYRVQGGGFFSNLWTRIKSWVGKPAVKELIHKGITAASKLGQQQIEKHLPQIGEKVHSFVQRRMFGKNDHGPMSDKWSGAVSKATELAKGALQSAEDYTKKKVDGGRVSGGRVAGRSLLNPETLKILEAAKSSSTKGGGVRLLKK